MKNDRLFYASKLDGEKIMSLLIYWLLLCLISSNENVEDSEFCAKQIFRRTTLAIELVTEPHSSNINYTISIELPWVSICIWN
jgi:hypothetical protein